MRHIEEADSRPRQDDYISLGREVGGAAAEEGGSVWGAVFVAHPAGTKQPLGPAVVVGSGRVERIYPHLVRRMDNTSAAYVHRHVSDLLWRILSRLPAEKHKVARLQIALTLARHKAI